MWCGSGDIHFAVCHSLLVCHSLPFYAMLPHETSMAERPRNRRLCFCMLLLIAPIALVLLLLVIKVKPSSASIASEVRTPPAIAFTPAPFPVLAHVVNAYAPHTSDLSFIRDIIPVPSSPVHEIPQLAIFVRAGDAFLKRCVSSIDFPVATLAIIQDSEDDKRVKLAVEALAAEYAGPGRFIRSILHIVNMPHTGCSQAWNTAFRINPTLPFWLFSANDVLFPPGVLGKFYASVRRDALEDPNVGMVSTSVDFGTDGKKVRKTFGLMAWAVTRQGVLRGGLYDENFFPG